MVFDDRNGGVRRRNQRKCAEDSVNDAIDGFQKMVADDSAQSTSESSIASSETGGRIADSAAFTDYSARRPAANSHLWCAKVSPLDGMVAYTRRHSPSSELIILEFSFRQLIPFIIGAPIFATFVAFFIGLALDYQLILNYEWTCGRVHLPSFSRIINLPKERVFWNLFTLFHIGLRPVLLCINYGICKVPGGKVRRPLVHSLLTKTAFLCGTVEIILLAALTVVGERENPDLHVVFFSLFTVFSLVYFFLTSLLFRMSEHHQTHENGALSYKLKITLSTLYLILLPAIYVFFTLYWQLCFNFAYDFFAGFEYATILVNYGFHATAVLDCNDVYQLKMEIDESPTAKKDSH